MPGPRRRKGARSGRLADAVIDAFDAETHRLAALEEPVEVIQAVGDAFAAMDAQLERFAHIRIRAVQELRSQGWTYRRIAEVTGLSEERVGQLARAGGAVGRVKDRGTV